MNTNQLVKKIVDNNLCIGCGLCAGINPNAIEMKLDDTGFLIPVSNDSKENISQESIENSCPGINTYSDFTDEKGFWGKIIACYTGYSTNDSIRHSGSSGGAITALLDYLLVNKQIDGVIQIGPNFEKSPFSNKVYFNTTTDELIKCASSRYSPSSPLMTINNILEKNLTVAFVGKPCDVMALRNLAKFDERVDNKVKYMFSFFCAGLPSELASNNILKAMKVKKDDVISFRYRGAGWPGKTTATLKSKEKAELTYSESWGNILGKMIHYRCKICADSIGMSADVVAADAWHSSENGYPNFEERDGRSLLISRSTKGEDLLVKMKKNAVLSLKALDPNEIYTMQPGQVRKRGELLGRVLAVMSNPFQLSPRYRITDIYSLSKHTGFASNIISFLGIYKRIFTKNKYFKTK